MKESLIFAGIIAFNVVFWVLLVLLIYKRSKKRRTQAGAAPHKANFAANAHPVSILDREQLDPILERIAENTRCDSLRATLLAEPLPGLFSSKIGGLPYWDPSKPYPTDSQGEKLALLAQIDLSTLPETDELPREGLLQFFVLPDDVYGMNSDAPEVQEGFRVVYHATVDRSITEDTVRAMDIPTSFTCDDQLPVCGEFALRFSKESVHIGYDDYRFERELGRAARECGLSELDSSAVLNTLLKYDAYSEWFGGNEGTRILGYPSFTQDDPRPMDSPCDTLLFQLDSYFASNAHPASSPDRNVMWGDSGIGNFFIRKEDLAEKRFDRVYYTWDCY